MQKSRKPATDKLIETSTSSEVDSSSTDFGSNSEMAAKMKGESEKTQHKSLFGLGADRDYQPDLFEQTGRVLDCLGVINGDLNGVAEWVTKDSGLGVQVAADRLEDASGIQTALDYLANGNARLRRAQALLEGAGRIESAADAVRHLRAAADALERRRSDYDPENLAQHSEAILGDLDIARESLSFAADAFGVIGLGSVGYAFRTAAGSLSAIDAGVRAALPAIELRIKRIDAPLEERETVTEQGDLIPR